MSSIFRHSGFHNTLIVLVKGPDPSDTGASIVIGVEQVDAEKNVSYLVLVTPNVQRQCFSFPQRQQLQRKYIFEETLWKLVSMKHRLAEVGSLSARAKMRVFAIFVTNASFILYI